MTSTYPAASVATAPLATRSPSMNWGAVVAGAVAAAALTFVLMLLGSGLGLTIVSPWASESTSLSTFAVSTAIWLVLVQWLSSGTGGYLAGRLRPRRGGDAHDETFFRDSAHGLVTWALSTLLIVMLIGGAMSGVLGTGMRAASNVASEPPWVLRQGSPMLLKQGRQSRILLRGPPVPRGHGGAGEPRRRHRWRRRSPGFAHPRRGRPLRLGHRGRQGLSLPIGRQQDGTLPRRRHRSGGRGSRPRQRRPDEGSGDSGEGTQSGATFALLGTLSGDGRLHCLCRRRDWRAPAGRQWASSQR